MILSGNKQNSLILWVFFFFHFLGWRSPYIILMSASPGHKRKWHDYDCHRIKQRLQNLSYIPQRFPTYPIVRGNSISTKKHFRKLITYKYNKWQDSMLQSLINLGSTNPKEYWKLVKSLKQNQFDKSSHSQSYIIDQVTWYDCFKDLNKEHMFKTDDFHVNIDKIIDNYSIIAKKMVHVLDTKITANEVTKAIGKLKLNKSAGYVLICNEMNKSGSEILSSSLCKLFNLMLGKGYFPQNGQYDIQCQCINLKAQITQVIIEAFQFPVA